MSGFTSGDCRDSVEELADKLLCYRHREGQSPGKVAEWSQRIDKCLDEDRVMKDSLDFENELAGKMKDCSIRADISYTTKPSSSEPGSSRRNRTRPSVQVRVSYDVDSD